MPLVEIPPDILESLKRLLRQPAAATFVERSGETSRVVAGGPCETPAFSLAGDPNANTFPSRIEGTCEGCTENTFGLGPFQFGGENTRASTTTAISFFYAVPAARLRRLTYSFNSDERLRGRVQLKTLITLNGHFTTTEERDFFATITIQRHVRVFDGSQPVLSIVEDILSDGSSGNSPADGNFDGQFHGLEKNININKSSSLLTSQFAVSGDNDLVIRFDYVLSATAKGQTNRVTFTGLDGQSAFTVRNRGVFIQPDVGV